MIDLLQQVGAASVLAAIMLLMIGINALEIW